MIVKMAARHLGILSTAWGYTFTVIVVGALLIVAMVVGGMVLFPWLRRRFHPEAQDRARSPGGFTIEGLEAMRQSGRLSDEEFRTLRRQVLGLDAGGGKKDNSPLRAPRTADDETDAGPEDRSCADGDANEESR